LKTVLEYQHKKILVLGLARSGISAAQLLHKLGAFVTVNDYKPLHENKEAQTLLQHGIKVICGGHPIELLDEGFELIVKNPGIPYTNPIVEEGLKRKIPIVTEVEIAYKVSEADFISITGTNGKTTTTTLVYEMLKAGQLQTRVAGNIGTPVSEVAIDATPREKIVLELSSFQLMGVKTFKPKIAILTNLYEAHLDYHGTREAYVDAKMNITKNQDESDFFIVNFDQEECIERSKRSRAEIVPFSVKRVVENGAYLKDGVIYFRGEKVVHQEEIVLPGNHNIENILAAICGAKLLHVSNHAIREVLSTFKGVKHRLQFVRELNGRKFYNDSKATNILASKMALSSFTEPVILLAGGLDRGNGFEELIPSLKNVKALITFGQTAKKLMDAGKLAGIETIKRVDNVEKAVPLAYSLSESGDVILLSPACASWDQYKTFEVRGDIFIEAVHKL